MLRLHHVHRERLRKVEPEWYAAQEAVAAFETTFADAYLAWVKSVGGQVSADDLAQALASGKLAWLESEVDWVGPGIKLQDDLGAAMAEAVAMAGAEQFAALKIDAVFNVRNPYSEQWILSNAANKVTLIEASVRDGIRGYVSASFTDGVTPQNLARQIRPLIGLNGPQLDRMVTLHRGWMAEGLTEPQIQTRVIGAANKMRVHRASMIARTETIAAHGHGTVDSWLVARDAGFVLPTSVKVWVASPGSNRTCSICIGLHNEKQPLAGVFSNGSYAPGAHPMCRCSLAMETLTLADYNDLFL